MYKNALLYQHYCTVTSDPKCKICTDHPSIHPSYATVCPILGCSGSGACPGGYGCETGNNQRRGAPTADVQSITMQDVQYKLCSEQKINRLINGHFMADNYLRQQFSPVQEMGSGSLAG